jgi:D-alanine-D-alanine ligase
MKNKKKKAKPPGFKNGYKLPRKVAIIYSDVKREFFPTEEQYITEKDAIVNAETISKYLDKMHIRTHLYPGNALLPQKLRKDNPQMVFNLVDSFKGDEFLSSTIPGVLDLLEIPYTGAGILGLALGMNKFLSCKVLQQNGIPVPNFQLFNTPTDYLDPSLRFPLISKLNETHGAVEINQDSISDDEKHLRGRLKYLISTYKQPILVEEFIVGREISAFLLEGLNKKVYLAERVIHKQEGKYSIASFEIQWLDENPNVITYQKYEDPILAEYVRRAFNVTEMVDYGKFDIKVDNSGRYFFIDSNPNPFLGPKEVDAPMANILELHGISFLEILKRLIINTLRDAALSKR